ncbi:MAG: 50S ribosomal protein L7/L12 [Bacteroidia bacterium]|nr:50S ribosomal protein L7/L12 [Bacteroidia bacterium]
MADLKKFADDLVNLSVKEVIELADILKNEYGIVPAATTAMVSTQVSGEASATSTQAEKTTFDVILTSAGGMKLQVVKVVKDIMNIGLKESKVLIDAPPKAIKEGVSKEEAESIKAKLEEVGAEVEIK